ncbi:MAG: SAM-dependent DNA methyltransferase [Abitibacteriaceae bacterium]|nr:SAM-dependent DNA methyltransferase [Abditibacteriaceae bacterium]
MHTAHTPLVAASSPSISPLEAPLETSTAPYSQAPEPPGPLPQHIYRVRQRFEGFAIKKPDPAIHRDLTHGWMLPLLLRLDEWLWQRWDYWCQCCCCNGRLPDAPIPPIEFLITPHAGTLKMLEASLNCIPQHGSWQGWSNWQYFSYFLDWLLYAFGHSGHKSLPEEPAGCGGASHRLYQVVNVDALLLWPHDYLGHLLSEQSYGQKQGFFVTPHTVCEMMTRMVFDKGKDHRKETMLDPCVGTGRFPLHASNHTLRLYAQDIDGVLCKATLVNAYLYAPWLARPIPWLDAELAQVGQVPQAPPLEVSTDVLGTTEANEQAECAMSLTDSQSFSVAARLSDSMTEAAPPHAQGYLLDTEHDPQLQPSVAPILKRRRKGGQGSISSPPVGQGSLFADELPPL